jgi:hypothetical protein
MDHIGLMIRFPKEPTILSRALTLRLAGLSALVNKRAVEAPC